MTFRELETRLITLLDRKLRQGEISQRQLARMTGFTQPHIHNVLKGNRAMRPDLADALLASLGISVRDLLEEANPGWCAQEKALVWRGAVGPHDPFPDRPEASGHLMVPASFVARFTSPILLHVAADEDSMSPLIDPGDLVLVDRAKDLCSRPVFECVYVLSLGGHGALCRCQAVGASLVLLEFECRRPSLLPGRIALGKRSTADIVKGKVVWACRSFDSRG
jgi:hypothetical protein